MGATGGEGGERDEGGRAGGGAGAGGAVATPGGGLLWAVAGLCQG
jgi:hypothetical protein